MADRGGYDIRLEAAIAKLYTPRVDGHHRRHRAGSGAAAATRTPTRSGRGEKPVPVERIMRDFRINLNLRRIERDLHLFIRPRGGDKHLQVAGDW